MDCSSSRQSCSLSLAAFSQMLISQPSDDRNPQCSLIPETCISLLVTEVTHTDAVEGLHYVLRGLRKYQHPVHGEPRPRPME